MRQTLRLLREVSRRDDAVTSIEYAIIASLIAISIVAGVTIIGSVLSGTFNNVNKGFQ